MHLFTAVFLIVLAATSATRLWLDLRHIRHVRARRDAVPAEFSGVIELAQHQKAADYTVAKTRLAMAHTGLEAALVLAFTLGGGLQALSDLWVEGLGAGLASGLGVIASVVAITSVAELPLTAYRVFGIESRFGFNRMTVAMFVSDLVKQLIVAAALGLPILLSVLWLMEKAGTYWWLYAWVVWVLFNLLVAAIYPPLIAPLFNKFTPLGDGELKQRLERLLARCGFRSQGLYVMDSSRRSTHGNAYFTGFGRSKRIVLFDTLISRLDPPEVEAVLAHELGHYRLRHVVKRLAWSFAASLVALWLLGLLMEQDWFYAALGVTTPSTATALALFFLVLPLFLFPLRPLLAYYSRCHEYEADAYAAKHAPARSLVSALLKLYKDNAATLTPDPLRSAFYDSHPPVRLRIARLQYATDNG